MRKPMSPTNPSTSQTVPSGRLRLERLTLRKLTSSELHRVAGGMMSTSNAPGEDETCHRRPDVALR